MADTTVAFSYTGSDQTWTVPAGISTVTVVLDGGGGGSGASSSYVDPRGWNLTAKDILNMRDQAERQSGLVINVGTMNVRDASDARQAAGDLRYALASAGLG